MNFCTYFDSYYLHKGIALYVSLERVTEDFQLYVMAFDRECYDKLKSLQFKHMTVELIDDLERQVPELQKVKPTRSRGEYCWTCGPTVIQHFMEAYSLSGITYLDSDLMFLSDPHVVEQEIGDKPIAITEQGIPDSQSAVYGKYCVQYVFFRNDAEGKEALCWWRDACLEWCYARVEDGKFGDQKYLDEFPRRWDGVHVIKNFGVGIAPWNIRKYSYPSDTTLSYGGNTYRFVFFHMHGTRITIADNTLHLQCQHFHVTPVPMRLFYEPYAELLRQVCNTYLNQDIQSAKVHNISCFERFSHFVKDSIRFSTFVQWLYYDVLKKRYSGHGSKVS